MILSLFRPSYAAAGLPELVLAGPRVFLSPPQTRDWTDWADVRGRNRAFLQPFEPLWADGNLTRPFFVRRIARQAADWTSDRNYAFLLRETATRTLIGGVNLNHVCRGAAQYASLGYWLDQGHQGHGYMTEGLRLAIDFAFSTLRLHRLNAAVLPHNTRSKNVLTKLGFSEEGRARAYLQINGVWEDHVLYGLNRPSEAAGSTFLT